MKDILNYWAQFQNQWRKQIKPKQILGLALDDESLLVAEAHRGKEGLSVMRAARFVFPEDAGVCRPDRLGEALRGFLRENGFTARKAAVGIPAKWIVNREVNLPQASAAAVSGALRIHAEREFSLGFGELCIDYSGTIAENGPIHLMLSAMLKKRRDQILKLAEAAGFEVLSIQAAALGLFMSGGTGTDSPGPGCGLYLRPRYAELLMRREDGIIDVKYFQRREAAETEPFLSEVRRALFPHMKWSAEAAGGRLWIWNASGAPGAWLYKKICGAFSADTACEMGDGRTVFEKFAPPEPLDMDLYGAPAALAVRAFSEPSLFIADFLNSRMAAKPRKIEKRHVVWASAVLAGLLICLGVMIFSWKRNVNEVAHLRAKLAGMQSDFQSAKNVVLKVSEADRWYAGRSGPLDCLRQLTLLFPEEGSIWTTSLALDEDMGGIITGKATGEQYVIDVMDKMKKSPFFSDVQMIYMRESGRNTQEISFSISFVFKN